MLLTVIRYSFCRVADDLVDDANTESDAREWISKLTHFLDLAYASKEARIISKQPNLHSYISETFPKSDQSSLRLLPTHILSFGPFYELLEGFKTDMSFPSEKVSKKLQFFPIKNAHELEVYASRVASTVAELSLELVFHHSHYTTTEHQREHLIQSGRHMGIALQYVNISRDVSRDAKLGRVYLPTTWLNEENLSPQQILKKPEGPLIEKLRNRLLGEAFEAYHEARAALDQLPADVRAPMRVAIESYMEIGRVMKQKGYDVNEGKATVPMLRRLKVAWSALNEG